jgi:hypothetical protein
MSSLCSTIPNVGNHEKYKKLRLNEDAKTSGETMSAMDGNEKVA